MTCKQCARAATGMWHGIGPDCRACKLRDIALGPHFFAALRAGRINLESEYAAQLRHLGDIAAVHAEVEAVAKALHTGAIAV